MAKPTPPPPIDISKPDAVPLTFAEERVRFTIARMASVRDKDDLVSHPLRRLVLVEYGNDLAKLLAAVVPAGHWAPSSSYGVLVAKRSGAFRELVFPALIDSIVGRRVIDELEPRITKDDNNRAFCGRTHASSNRAPGDYSDWFKVWQDFTSSIASAAAGEGFAFVFETDIADFFPSVDRARARQVLAQRSAAHPTIVELLFYCLEAWLPRFHYAQGTGLPVEPNDISRLVAHAFVKAIDENFPDTSVERYRRWVDDTVVFVDSRERADDVRRRHHLALRSHGLAPNGSKTAIVSIEDYEAGRHRDINLRLDRIAIGRDAVGLGEVVQDWYARDRKATESWDQVARRLYSLAGRLGSDVLRPHAVPDALAMSAMADHSLRYLGQFALSKVETAALVDALSARTASVELLIEVAEVLAEAPLAVEVDADMLASKLTDFICRTDDRHGAGFAKARALLGVAKHGKRAHRERLLKWASVGALVDEQLRLHFAYVLSAFDELPAELAASLRHVRGDDFELATRLCGDARGGRLRQLRRLLDRSVEQVRGTARIRASYLPFLRVVFEHAAKAENGAQRDICRAWLKATLAGKRGPVNDACIKEFLTARLGALES